MKPQFSKNVRAVRNSHELTQKQLADRVGVREQTVIKREGGDVEKPRQKAIVDKLCEVFGVAEQDLFGYADGFYAKLRGLAEAPAGAISPTGSVSAFPPLRGRVRAGDPTDPENLDGAVELPASVAANRPHAYFLEVEGDCMDRVCPEGYYILVDPDRAPADGSIAAVSLDGTEHVMRRLRMGATSMMLPPESDNPEHADIVVRQGDGRTVGPVGTVVRYQAKKEMEQACSRKLQSSPLRELWLPPWLDAPKSKAVQKRARKSRSKSRRPTREAGIRTRNGLPTPWKRQAAHSLTSRKAGGRTAVGMSTSAPSSETRTRSTAMSSCRLT